MIWYGIPRKCQHKLRHGSLAGNWQRRRWKPDSFVMSVRAPPTLQRGSEANETNNEKKTPERTTQTRNISSIEFFFTAARQLKQIYPYEIGKCIVFTS